MKRLFNLPWSLVLILLLWGLVGQAESVASGKLERAVGDAAKLLDEIKSLPDRWGGDWRTGASSNNYAMLSRVAAFPDVHQRIALVRALRDHFRKPHKWYAVDGRGKDGAYDRLQFLDMCAGCLVHDRNATADAVMAGWRMRSENLDDLERILRSIDGQGGGGQDAWCADGTRLNFAHRLRRRYAMFFADRLYDCACSYRNLPPERQTDFVEQVKRDFFGRRGMKNFRVGSLPEPFRDWSVQNKWHERDCYDEDSCTPLCTNWLGRGCCHWLNIANTLKWQRDDLKEGLSCYGGGDAGKLLKTVYYLSAYARKLERRGRGYEAATNAYCALSWLHRGALRGNDYARVACSCCLQSGGALGRHAPHMWSGPDSCHSHDLHDVPVQAMAFFEPAPDYLVDVEGGVRRYARAYARDAGMADEYAAMADARLRSWHEMTHLTPCGWQQASDSVEIVHIDFTGIDVVRHVEDLVRQMDADIELAARRYRLDCEEERREKDERALERTRGWAYAFR